MKGNKSSLLCALIIAIGIAALGLFIKSGIDNLAYHDRKVTVKGLAEREVMANHVVWPITYQLNGNDLLQLYDTMTKNNNVIIKFLTSNGINKEDIVTNPPSTYDRESNSYNNNPDFKYSLSCCVTVNTNDVETVIKLLDRQSELLKDGVPYSNSYIDYSYTGLNDIKPDMIAEATKNAREAAYKFADDSGSKIGKIKNATQGQFSIDNIDSSVPYKMKVRVVTTIEYYIEN